MKYKFRLILSALALLVAEGMIAQGTFETVTIDGKEFALEQEEAFQFDFDQHGIGTDGFPYENASNPAQTNYFEADGKFYFNIMRDVNPANHLYVFDKQERSHAGFVELQFDDGAVQSPVAAVFAGSDADGTPYVVSNSNSRIQDKGYPFAINIVDIRNGVPYAVAGYVMRLLEGMAPVDVTVEGSIKSGKFSVYVIQRSGGFSAPPLTSIFSRTSDKANEALPSTLVRYDFDSTDSAEPAAYATALLSSTTVYPHGNGTFTLFDANIYGTVKGKFEYSMPTLCRFAGSGATTIETIADDFSGTLAEHSAGIAHGTVGDKTLICYGNKLSTDGYEYTIAHAPKYPASYANMKSVWTIADEPSKYDPEKISHARGVLVKPRKSDDGALHFDIFSTPNRFASYAVRPVGQQTEVGDVTAVPSEAALARYYTITGQAVERPTLPGLYIVVEGSTARKFVVR